MAERHHPNSPLSRKAQDNAPGSEALNSEVARAEQSAQRSGAGGDEQIPAMPSQAEGERDPDDDSDGDGDGDGDDTGSDGIIFTRDEEGVLPPTVFSSDIALSDER
ncbi:hypothetical protein FHS96_000913 [Sphingomonas zeicaulis]|uniref:hypothetical protein n=1 Tax=Sphingomonas zeicaulis TaxID=1632740 RepID=UPI003D1E69B9